MGKGHNSYTPHFRIGISVRIGHRYNNVMAPRIRGDQETTFLVSGTKDMDNHFLFYGVGTWSTKIDRKVFVTRKLD